MASQSSGNVFLVLDRLPSDPTTAFTIPTKKINDGDDLTFLLSSTAYRDLMTWLLQLNRSMFPTKGENGRAQPSSLTSPSAFSETVQNLRNLISELSGLIEEAPPETGPRRFGNVAFRTWHKLVEENVDRLCSLHLSNVLSKHDGNQDDLKSELKVYLIGSFGSAQRLDYGTGHELSFLAFLGCLWKLGAFEDGEERAVVMGVIQAYLELIRRLVLTYTLEPAGSHGVWGLDDHSFIPYIFGSAQYGPAISSSDITPTEGSVRGAPSPSKVTDKDVVADYKDSNMYFSAIQFIYDVKKGPFWEHSPVLYDISGIKDGWGKINKGMLKMYAAEVLGKFPVVQHFPLGSIFKWEADPEARTRQNSVHSQQQPPARSMDVPPAPQASGTKAPWAGQTASAMPSTRAPWANPGNASNAPPPPGTGVLPTAAPWAATQRRPPPAGKVADRWAVGRIPPLDRNQRATEPAMANRDKPVDR